MLKPVAVAKNLFELLGWKALIAYSLYVFVDLFTRNAWVVDDAYITFRTVDNFINGHGLTWNIHERVQVYTHPMWMFLISLSYWLSGDIFKSAIWVSLGLCLASVAVGWVYLRRRGEWRILVLLLLMMASKAVTDYTSSGLENPLSYLLAVFFMAEYLLRGDPSGQRSRRSLFFLFFTASLAFFNRSDTLIIYMPALLHLLVVNAPRMRLRLIPLLLLATLPATLWELFSLFYYGFPFPNTAYAKVITPSFPPDVTWDRGVEYLKCSISSDALAFIVFIFTLVLAVWRKSLPAAACVAGVLLYGYYVVATAASATHMAGRFFALPFFVTFVAFSMLVESKKDLAFFVLLTVAFVKWNPMAPTKLGEEEEYKSNSPTPNCIDTNWYVHKEGMALENFKEHKTLPFHAWLEDGKKLSQRKDARIHLGGARGGEAIGYFGFGAGPQKIVIDYVGLGDPLLARLPPVFGGLDKSGHHYRYIPRGYIQSFISGKNVIEDPSLRQYYDRLVAVTQGDLFSYDRLVQVVKMNMGSYQHLLDGFLAGKEYREVQKNCAALKNKSWLNFMAKCSHHRSRFFR